MSPTPVVEGNASYRVDADLDDVVRALAIAEHRMRVAASMRGGCAGPAELYTFMVDGLVLVRYRAPLTPIGGRAEA